nr:IPT/TIG domain-containing protein [Actinomycetota bacterium]
TAASKDALAGGGWTDSQIASAYGITGLYARGDLGAGQTIAVFELEPFSPADLATFDRCFFGASHLSQVQAIPVDGFALSGPGSGESILDIENLSALAPAAKILVYEAPNTTFGSIDEYNTIVSQDRANIVSTSWGECEAALETGAPGAQQLENTIFEEAAAQGQTVVSAAGDTGSDDCAGTPFGSSRPVRPYLSVDDPASQPYVLGVGGTSLLDTSNPPSQTVWNHGNDWGGGGGGISSTWPIPSWQAASGVPGVGTSGGREVPDVSASADEWRGVTVYSAAFGTAGKPSSTDWSTIGGTSSAAPIWAAALADIAGSGGSCAALPVTAGGPDLGFVPPELYSVASSPASYAQSFSDVTVGNNDVFGLGLGYDATPGYNLASGLGTPIVTNAAGSGGLAASLCAKATATAAPAPPQVSGVSPSSGPISGGTVVTITGSGFAAASTSAVHVSFGSAAATVTSVNSTTITVVAPPASSTTGSAPFGPAGGVDVVVTQGVPASSSAVGPASRFEYVLAGPASSSSPVVTGIGPSGGNVSGGSAVTVYGAGFASATPTVTFGGVPSSSVHVLGDTELTAVVPPESAATRCATGAGFAPSATCQVQVVVSSSAGTSPTAPILPALSGAVVFNPQGVVEPTPETEVAPAATEYDYAPTPVITSVVPDPADATGSTPVTITGSGFNLTTFEWVNFGPPSSSASEQVQISSITPTQITIVPPGGNAGRNGALSALAGGVSVQTQGGLSATWEFAYAGTPTVRSLSALGGPVTGGTHLVVRGTGLSDVTSVDFVSEVSPGTYGGSSTSILSSVGPTSLELVVPAGLPGPVDVQPCTPTACARPNPSVDTFVYYGAGPPSLVAVRPSSGPASGGTRVVLFGNNLDGALGARFGSFSTSRLASTPGYPDGDPYVLTADAPPGPASRSVPVAVVTRNGTTASGATVRYRYRPSAPSPPRALSVRLAGVKAILRWVAPASDGGSPVTSYTAIATTVGSAPVVATVSATAREAVLGGMLAGRAYSFRVRAANARFGRGLAATTTTYLARFAADGYRIASSSGVVTGFGTLPALGGVGGAPGPGRIVAIAGTPDGGGYWLVSSTGTVYPFGDAPPYPYAHPGSPVVGIAPVPAGGYLELTSSGQVFAFGRAHDFGEPGPTGTRTSPAVAIASAPDGRGYYVVNASGTVHAYGDARRLAGHGAPLSSAVVAIAVMPDGRGYWLVSASGQVRAYGTAPALGSVPASRLEGQVVGIALTANGRGYWLATTSGAVYAFGDARFEGRASPVGSRYAGIATD